MLAVSVTFSAKTQLWCAVAVVVAVMVMEVAALEGPNVCMVKQKYNITKRVKYRAPMSVRTYEWCFSMPPRCSKWNTEMRDLTRLETEERTAEVAVCCPGYKMRDVSCVPICPNGKTGHGCSQDCPTNKWGPNCVNDCRPCEHGTCSPISGVCSCQEGWQGESCEKRMLPSTTSATPTTTTRVEDLLTSKSDTKPSTPATSPVPFTTRKAFETTTVRRTTSLEILLSLNTILAPDITTVNIPTTLLDTNIKSNVTASSEIPPIFNKSSLSENTSMTTSSTSTLSTSTAIENKVKITTPATETTLLIAKNNQSPSKEITPFLDVIKDIDTKIQTFDNPATYTKVSYVFTTTETSKSTEFNRNKTIVSSDSGTIFTPKINVVKSTPTTTYNPTEFSTEAKNFYKIPVGYLTTPKSTVANITKQIEKYSASTPKTTYNSTEAPRNSHTSMDESTRNDITKRPDATIRYFPTTVKFKPKEIWIRPAQKGEQFVEIKKNQHDLHSRHRAATNKDPGIVTTPKTIMVSIIPTSISYATFKKISLTTASLLSQKSNSTLKVHNVSAGQGVTNPMSVITTTLTPLTTQLLTTPILKNAKPDINSTKSYFKVTISTLSNEFNVMNSTEQTVSLNRTNSMTANKATSSRSVTPTLPSTNFSNVIKTKLDRKISNVEANKTERVTKHPYKKFVTMKPRNVTIITVSGKNNDTVVKVVETVVNDLEKPNATKIKDVTNAKTNQATTDSPEDEETFHILTEPEHITAVMEGKSNERTSVNLISVISIAGGVMMAVITVAVIIVMVERCKRPRYEDVRKMNNIDMQVVIDDDEIPPPYVRSIFHTPLPDPPSSEKCHYQPISTLDRNLKQFMRPVIVQTISPIMFENFRGILECHYDHLPRRSHEFELREKHFSIPPSSDNRGELSRLRPCSVAESTIDALKCEAQLDVIDSTTSEPLYAEIPCWRPPSEHAIEIISTNGEAVTEL